MALSIDWLKRFRGERKTSAQLAKDRLLVAVAIQRAELAGKSHVPPYLQKMREEIVAVVRKYVQVPEDAVRFSLQRDHGLEILELNITLPEHAA
jgi:cell division topological specificity factor